MTSAEDIPIASEALEARISTCGAELQSLRTAVGVDLQWDGDPAVWSGRAPILFPIVGALVNGRYRLDGRTYAMEKHGFAHHLTFEVVERSSAAATLRLEDDADTREHYPFAFRLDLTFSLDGPTLTLEALLTNPGETPLPASLGFHPAFRWPLPFGQPQSEHRIRFDREEPAPVRRIDKAGVLTPELNPTPVEGRALQLRDMLFEDDALLFNQIASRRLLYGGAGGPQIEMRFDDFPMFGAWTKPRADFIALGPRAGEPDPQGFAGDLRERPGIFEVVPGASRRLAMHVTLVSGDA